MPSRRAANWFRSSAAAFAPGRFPYAQFALALAIGAAGGWLFYELNMPLPWMLGSMAAATIAALLRAPVAAPRPVRAPMTAVIGVMLGAGFSPSLLASAAGWLPTLLGLALFTIAAGFACVLYFRKVAGFDPVTSYFSGMPGGLMEMTLIGGERGGDIRLIALVHSSRLMLLVFTLPFLVRLWTDSGSGPRPQLGVALAQTPWQSHVWLVAAAIMGVVVGRWLRMPAPQLMGPMVTSGVIHVLGLSDFLPPTEIVAGAQVVLGTFLGCSFLGAPARLVFRVLRLSVGSTLILLAVTFLFAFAVSRVSSYGVIPLVLAYSPGGVAEMSLIALALQIEVAFVAVHHLARVLLVVAGADWAFRWMQRRRGET